VGQLSVIGHGLWMWSVVGCGQSLPVVVGCQLSVVSWSSAVVFSHGQQLVVNHQLWSVVISRWLSVVVGCAVMVIHWSSSVVVSHQTSVVSHGLWSWLVS